jgi:hypothetical protein
MTLTIDELEQRCALLQEAFETITAIDEARAGKPVTASTAPRGTPGASQIERMAAIRPGQASPSATAHLGNVSRPTIVAAAAGGDVFPGQPLETPQQLGRLMADVHRNLGMEAASSTPRRQVVASVRWEYPEERTLTGNRDSDNAKLEAVCGLNAQRYSRSTGAITASGGICLPVNVDFAVPTWSTADRPLRDGLPAFEASRGGLYFVSPPDIGVPPLEGTASGAGESVTTWTEATDADPAGATKPVWTVECGTEQQVFVSAIATRVQFGNMQARFAPEQLAANTQQALAVSARQAELQLLTTIADNSKQVIPAEYLGASRDVLTALDLLKSQYADSHRIPRSAGFTAIFPAWAKDMLRADLAREVAHDNAGSIDVLAVSDAQIDDYFTARGVNVIWTLDALKAGTYGTGGSAIPNQMFSLLGTDAPAPQWPGQSDNGAFTLAWFLFVEGSFQFLDGGRLDLGIIRDSLTSATNDFQTFVESFETAAFRGLECYQVQSTIKVTGGSAGTVSSSSYAE